MRNEFIASLTSLPHSIEITVSRYSKETGGLSSKTETPGATERWTRINYILAALGEHKSCIVRKRKVTKHIELGTRRLIKDETDVQMLKKGITA